MLGRWTGHCSVLFTQNCSSWSGNTCIYDHKNEQAILGIKFLRLRGQIWGHQVKIPVQNKADFFIFSSHLAPHSSESPLRMTIIYNFPGLFFHVLNCESNLSLCPRRDFLHCNAQPLPLQRSCPSVILSSHCTPLRRVLFHFLCVALQPTSVAEESSQICPLTFCSLARYLSLLFF